MNFFRKLERKFGRFAIPNLMYYIIMMYAAGFVMSLFNPYFYVQYLALDAAAILRGQVWRIVTDRKSTRLNSSHVALSRMPSSA